MNIQNIHNHSLSRQSHDTHGHLIAAFPFERPHFMNADSLMSRVFHSGFRLFSITRSLHLNRPVKGQVDILHYPKGKKSR